MLSGGRIVASGGPELAEELETTGYAAYGSDEPVVAGALRGAGTRAQLSGNDPFADPLA